MNLPKKIHPIHLKIFSKPLRFIHLFFVRHLNPEKKPIVILIAGPTAVGKTSLSIKLAEHFHTSILSADSRQCYREMTIGTAKPSPSELKAITHFFINSHSVYDEVNAAMYEKLGLHYLQQIFSQNPIAIVCGGTGLYIQSLLEGIDDMPPIPDKIRTEVQHLYEAKGLEGLQKTLQEKDPLFYEQAEQKNPRRLMRALEVWEATGKSIVSFRKKEKVVRPFEVIRIGLELPRERLLENIAARTKEMIRSGLIEEAKNLLPLRHLKALQTVGYTEIFRYLDGDYDLIRAENEIILHTRQYAKRQMTWFKKDSQMHWFNADRMDEIMQYLCTKVGDRA